MTDARLWVWDTDPGVINKQCKHCAKAMRYDRHAAVTYKEETYHNYCLMDMLTEYHTHNSGEKKVDTATYFWGMPTP